MALETDFDQFWLQLGGVKRGPLEAQFLTLLALKCVLAPQPPHDPSKRPLGPPQDPSKRPLGPPQGPSKRPLGTDFGFHFERFCMYFGARYICRSVDR